MEMYMEICKWIQKFQESQFTLDYLCILRLQRYYKSDKLTFIDLSKLIFSEKLKNNALLITVAECEIKSVLLSISKVLFANTCSWRKVENRILNWNVVSKDFFYSTTLTNLSSKNFSFESLKNRKRKKTCCFP